MKTFLITWTGVKASSIAPIALIELAKQLVKLPWLNSTKQLNSERYLMVLQQLAFL